MWLRWLRKLRFWAAEAAAEAVALRDNENERAGDMEFIGA
jgi:hypothetical protein